MAVKLFLLLAVLQLGAADPIQINILQRVDTGRRGSNWVDVPYQGNYNCPNSIFVKDHVCANCITDDDVLNFIRLRWREPIFMKNTVVFSNTGAKPISYTPSQFNKQASCHSSYGPTWGCYTDERGFWSYCTKFTSFNPWGLYCNGQHSLYYGYFFQSSIHCLPDAKALFEGVFKSNFNKKYENEEEELMRFQIFMDNYLDIENHNILYESGKSNYTMGINIFTDMTYEEVIAKYTGLEDPEHSDSHQRHKRSHEWYIPQNIGKEPESIDYRDMGAVNPIRNQGSCGSCWAFAIVSSLESQIFLKHGELLELSEQDLVDCSKSYGPNGCNGGRFDGPINYIKDNGIALRAGYPYITKDGTCNELAAKTSYKVKGQMRVKQGKDTELLNALVHMGPIAIGFYTSKNFYKYRDGIFTDELCTDESQAGHAMVLVGYGTENGQDYWLVRNSWGQNDTKWGDKGYIKVARDIKNHCWISQFGYIPITEVCDTPGAHVVGQPKQCLYFSTYTDGRQTWDGAIATCAAMGGALASLLDPQAVKDYARNNDWWGWVGGTDDVDEGTWRWIDGQPVGSTLPWGKREPDQPDHGRIENCLFVQHNGYADNGCSNEYRYVCDLGKFSK